MLIFAIALAALAVVVLKRKEASSRPPYESPEYRIDDRVVASILLLLAAGFTLLGLIG